MLLDQRQVKKPEKDRRISPSWDCEKLVRNTCYAQHVRGTWWFCAAQCPERDERSIPWLSVAPYSISLSVGAEIHGSGPNKDLIGQDVTDK